MGGLSDGRAGRGHVHPAEARAELNLSSPPTEASGVAPAMRRVVQLFELALALEECCSITGVTRVSRDGVEVGRVVTAAGRLCCLSTRRGHVRLGELLGLHEARVLPHLRAAIEEAQREGKLLGEVLVESGSSTLRQVREALVRQASLGAWRMVAESMRGRLALEPDMAVAGACPTPTFSPLDVYAEATRSLRLDGVCREIWYRHALDVGIAIGFLRDDRGRLAPLCWRSERELSLSRVAALTAAAEARLPDPDEVLWVRCQDGGYVALSTDTRVVLLGGAPQVVLARVLHDALDRMRESVPAPVSGGAPSGTGAAGPAPGDASGVTTHLSRLMAAVPSSHACACIHVPSRTTVASVRRHPSPDALRAIDESAILDLERCREAPLPGREDRRELDQFFSGAIATEMVCVGRHHVHVYLRAQSGGHALRLTLPRTCQIGKARARAREVAHALFDALRNDPDHVAPH